MSNTIVDIAVNAGMFNTLLAAVEAAGLGETLMGAGPFTVFAPTDEAFAKLPEGTVEALLEDPEKLAGILKYHVVAGKVQSTDLAMYEDGDMIPTISGAEVMFHKDENGLRMQKANIIKADIEADNGVVHVIDGVLMPPM